GSRVVTGLVVDHGARADVDAANLKAIRQVLDAEALVPPDVVELARWTAEYYAAGPGDTITAVLPPKARGARADAHKTRRVASLTVWGLDALSEANAAGTQGAVTPRQRAALQILAGVPDG